MKGGQIEDSAQKGVTLRSLKVTGKKGGMGDQPLHPPKKNQHCKLRNILYIPQTNWRLYLRRLQEIHHHCFNLNYNSNI